MRGVKPVGFQNIGIVYDSSLFSHKNLLASIPKPNLLPLQCVVQPELQTHFAHSRRVCSFGRSTRNEKPNPPPLGVEVGGSVTGLLFGFGYHYQFDGRY